jgi:hypothetical protein
MEIILIFLIYGKLTISFFLYIYKNYKTVKKHQGYIYERKINDN